MKEDLARALVGFKKDVVLGEIMRDFGQDAVDKLIRDHGLEQKWEIKPGTVFTSAFDS